MLMLFFVEVQIPRRKKKNLFADDRTDDEVSNKTRNVGKNT